MYSSATAATATTVTPTAPMSHGSLTRSRMDASVAPMSIDGPRPRFAARRAPGRRLISIIGLPRSCDLAQGQADGEHEQRGNLVGDEAVQRAVAHLEVDQRVRLLHREVKTICEHVGEAGNSRSATTRVDRPDLATGAGRGGEEGGRTLDANCDLFTAAIEHRIEVLGTVVALEQLLRLVRRQTALTLQVFAEAAGAGRAVTRAGLGGLVQDVGVGEVLAGVFRRPESLHRGPGGHF